MAIKEYAGGVDGPASAGMCSIIKVHLHTMRLGATSDVAHTVNGPGPFPSVRVLKLGRAAECSAPRATRMHTYRIVQLQL